MDRCTELPYEGLLRLAFVVLAEPDVEIRLARAQRVAARASRLPPDDQVAALLRRAWTVGDDRAALRPDRQDLLVWPEISHPARALLQKLDATSSVVRSAYVLRVVEGRLPGDVRAVLADAGGADLDAALDEAERLAGADEDARFAQRRLLDASNLCLLHPSVRYNVGLENRRALARRWKRRGVAVAAVLAVAATAVGVRTFAGPPTPQPAAERALILVGATPPANVDLSDPWTWSTRGDLQGDDDLHEAARDRWVNWSRTHGVDVGIDQNDVVRVVFAGTLGGCEVVVLAERQAEALARSSSCEGFVVAPGFGGPIGVIPLTNPRFGVGVRYLTAPHAGPLHTATITGPSLVWTPVAVSADGVTDPVLPDNGNCRGAMVLQVRQSAWATAVTMGEERMYVHAPIGFLPYRFTTGSDRGPWPGFPRETAALELAALGYLQALYCQPGFVDRVVGAPEGRQLTRIALEPLARAPVAGQEVTFFRESPDHADNRYPASSVVAVVSGGGLPQPGLVRSQGSYASIEGPVVFGGWVYVDDRWYWVAAGSSDVTRLRVEGQGVDLDVQDRLVVVPGPTDARVGPPPDLSITGYTAGGGLALTIV